MANSRLATQQTSGITLPDQTTLNTGLDFAHYLIKQHLVPVQLKSRKHKVLSERNVLKIYTSQYFERSDLPKITLT